MSRTRTRTRPSCPSYPDPLHDLLAQALRDCRDEQVRRWLERLVQTPVTEVPPPRGGTSQ